MAVHAPPATTADIAPESRHPWLDAVTGFARPGILIEIQGIAVTQDGPA